MAEAGGRGGAGGAAAPLLPLLLPHSIYCTLNGWEGALGSPLPTRPPAVGAVNAWLQGILKGSGAGEAPGPWGGVMGPRGLVLSAARVLEAGRGLRCCFQLHLVPLFS